MLNKIEKWLKKPELNEQTREAFWDDEHISREMLRAHLDPDYEGASRKLDFIEQSVRWIGSVMAPQEFPRLLDLGCGPGLYTERFTKQGFRVTGIDLSWRSIGHAEESARKLNLPITYKCGNYLELAEKEAFDCATMIYCDYGALSESDRKELLCRVFQALRPGGRFLFDVFSAAHYEAYEEQQSWQMCPNGGFWNAGKYFLFQGNHRYPERTTLDQYAVVTEMGTKTYYLWNRCFSREELVSEVEAAGFQILEVFGDVAGTSWQEDSAALAILLEKSYNNTI